MPQRGNAIEGVVTSIIPNGRHGPYAVAIYQGKSITFSLKPPVWNEQKYPHPGNRILLSLLKKTNSGWRAEKASQPVLH